MSLVLERITYGEEVWQKVGLEMVNLCLFWFVSFTL